MLAFGTVGTNLSTGSQSHSHFPLADWLFSYQKDWLRPDLIAGLTAAAVVIPKAMAYATIAGLPVQVGLYTAIVPMVIYAVLGTSRPLSVANVGPTLLKGSGFPLESRSDTRAN